MNAQQHAANFLLSIDPRCSIRKIGRAVFDAADTDEEFSKMLDEIQRKLGDGRDLITDEHAFDFTLPIDPQAAIRRIGKRVLEAAETEDSIASKLNAIQKKLSDGRPIVGNEHSAILL